MKIWRICRQLVCLSSGFLFIFLDLLRVFIGFSEFSLFFGVFIVLLWFVTSFWPMLGLRDLQLVGLFIVWCSFHFLWFTHQWLNRWWYEYNYLIHLKSAIQFNSSNFQYILPVFGDSLVVWICFFLYLKFPIHTCSWVLWSFLSKCFNTFYFRTVFIYS